jgi:formate/nitrite transporter FocA (FNT family)
MRDEFMKTCYTFAVAIAAIVIVVCADIGYLVLDAMTGQFPLDPSIKMWIVNSEAAKVFSADAVAGLIITVIGTCVGGAILSAYIVLKEDSSVTQQNRVHKT